MISALGNNLFCTIRPKLSEKAVTGKIYTFIIALIIGIIAIIFLWNFFGTAVTYIVGMVQNVLSGMKCWMCDMLPFPFGCSEC